MKKQNGPFACLHALSLGLGMTVAIGCHVPALFGMVVMNLIFIVLLMFED